MLRALTGPSLNPSNNSYTTILTMYVHKGKHLSLIYFHLYLLPNKYKEKPT